MAYGLLAFIRQETMSFVVAETRVKGQTTIVVETQLCTSLRRVQAFITTSLVAFCDKAAGVVGEARP